MWDELSRGALGAVVLADTRRLECSFSAVDFFERRGIGFVVAVNEFDGSFRYGPEEVRAAIDLKPDVPVVLCDARIASSGIQTLLTLVQHLLTTAPEPRGSDATEAPRLPAVPRALQAPRPPEVPQPRRESSRGAVAPEGPEVPEPVE
jgi:hypothetical protein